MPPSAPTVPVPATAPATAKVIIPPKMPRLVLTVQQVSYEHGYVKIVGVAKNTGTKGARSPILKLSVFDSPTGATLLVETSTWPAGQIGKTMDPATSAAFQFFASVPGEPTKVRWLISMDDSTPYEVVQPPKK
jgi:hypothetical protein